MSKRNNGNGLFVDTRFLRDHVYNLREQKKLAARLYEAVLAMRQHSDPSLAYQYTPILRDVEQLIEYFERMSRSLADIDDDVAQLSREMSELIEEDTEKTRHTVSGAIML